MKFTLTLMTTLLPLLTSAQNLSGEPPCATACIASAIQAAGCKLDDQGCPCGPSQTAIGTLAAPCLLASCPASLLGAVQSVGLALCAAYSSSLAAGLTTTGAGSASVIVTATATATATAAVVTSTTITATAAGNGTLGGDTKTGIPPVSVSSANGGNLTVTVNTSGVTSLTTKTGSVTAPSVASTSSTGGAGANYLVGSMGGLAAGFIGLVAAL